MTTTNPAANGRTATHQGECQLCGNLQKLPGGVLATHGYTVEWGFFEGICPGSGHLPYELSAGLIGETAERAERDAVTVQARADLMAAGGDEYTLVRRPTTYKGQDPYALVLRASVRVEDGLVYFAELDGKEESTRAYGRTLEQVLRDGDAARLARLQDAAQNLREYAAYLRARLAKWSERPQALQTVKAAQQARAQVQAQAAAEKAAAKAAKAAKPKRYTTMNSDFLSQVQTMMVYGLLHTGKMTEREMDKRRKVIGDAFNAEGPAKALSLLQETFAPFTTVVPQMADGADPYASRSRDILNWLEVSKAVSKGQ